METSRKDIERWFDDGVNNNKDFMIVVCDTFDHEDYPVYVSGDREACQSRYEYYRKEPMQRVMEVYDLKCDRRSQISANRSFPDWLER